MYKIKNDIIGRKFGRLIVLERTTKNNRGYYKCLCDCGNTVTVRADKIKDGSANSCGCYTRDRAKNGDLRRTHGKHGTRLYRIWQSMKARCNIKTIPAYENYGGRGITVCQEWENDFQVFYDWAMANGYADNLSIDRKDVNGNYEPSNCKWATRKEQQNNRRNNHLLTYNGVTKTASEWAESVGISADTILRRVKDGWNVERAITTKPIRMGL